MPDWRLARRAAADLDAIWRYTARTWSEVQAERYHDTIIDEIEKLAAGKRVGHSVEARKGYLKHAVGSHIIIFRRSDTGIHVIRILHQRLDAGRHL